MIVIIYFFSGLLGIMISSLVEYLLHRYILHRSSSNIHMLVHHRIFYGDSSFSQSFSRLKDILSSPVYVIANILCYLPAGILMILSDFLPGVIFLAAGISYTLWIEWVHLRFHKPSRDIFEDNIVFLGLKEHHRIHHTVLKSNFGIGSDLWDRIFFTMEKSI